VRKFKFFRLKNEMLFTNYAAIFLGACAAIYLTYRSVSPQPAEAVRLATRAAWIFEPSALFLMTLLTVIYERPIRRCLEMEKRQEPIPHEINLRAQQKLLNEPFFLITLDIGMWICAAVFYSLLFWVSEVGDAAVYHTFSQSLQNGLITTVVAFFLLRRILQTRMAPHFFPDGGLYLTPKTYRIGIGLRLAALLLACNLVPLFAIINTLQGTLNSNQNTALVVKQLQSNITVNALIFMGAGILLTLLVGRNLKQPFKEIIQVLQGIRNGNFDQKIKVTSNDEIGYTGDMINEMTEGLKERDQMRHLLELAKEVQQNFLPKSDPQLSGLDIAGQSIYCDRTGGDYYDYLDMGGHQPGKIGIVVGDVSGHGIPSALLMTSVRSSLRQRALLSGSIAQIVTDVNRQLARDVEESGRFMTMFCSEIDTHSRSIRWVRAGHEPAIFYDPDTRTIEELKGPGMALGVDESCRYEENQKSGLTPGQIIVLGTDGIWEAHNAMGEMFGKESLFEIIRQYAESSAKQIVTAIIDALNRFRHDVIPEDDVTLVVVKVVT
jgi:sigma-B regulation protein RsbU (phosphoserine phosphatase)